jgi:type IV pilus assembly protein PilP
MMNNKINGLIILLLSLMLIACGSSGTRDLNNYINNIKIRKSKSIEPLPEFTPLPVFIYPEQDSRRSPFKPRVVMQTDTFSPNVKRPKQPLEAFPLDALKFVGILKQGPVVWALIKQPDGLVTRVKPGDYMGQNYGQVINIKDKIIKVEEAVQVAGKWEKRDITINLKVPD